MLRTRLTLAFVTVFAATGLPAEGIAPERWSPPVDGPVVRGFEPPEQPYGPRHLGLDYAAPPGTPVRAAGDGIVAFAGPVGRSGAVSVDHPGARRTTYAYLRRVVARPGRPVRRGATIGIAGGRGPAHGAGVVHFGYRVGGRPEDPAPLLHRSASTGGPRPRVSLAPLDRPACPAGPGGPPGVRLH